MLHPRVAVLLVIAALCAPCDPLIAQQLTLRRYSVADGLAHDMVTSLLQDSRGYLWAGTFEGVSRFDGYRFRSYGIGDGLREYVVNDLVEDRSGRLWVGTNGGGVSVLDDSRPPPTESSRQAFRSFLLPAEAANYVNAMTVDAANRLWCATDSGVYVAALGSGPPEFRSAGFQGYPATAIWHDGRSVWTAVNALGVVEFGPEGHVVHAFPWSRTVRFHSVAGDGRGGLLVAADNALYALTNAKWTEVRTGLDRDDNVSDLLVDTRGVWIASTSGLLHLEGERVRRYSIGSGTPGRLGAMASDRDGNLWVSIERAGLVQIRSRQIVSYTPADGLPDSEVISIHEDVAGRIYAVTANGALVEVGPDGLVTLDSPPRAKPAQRLQRAAGGGWLGFDPAGVFTIPGPVPRISSVRRLFRLETAIPLPSRVSLVQQDAEGAVWVASAEPALYRLARIDGSAQHAQRWPLSLPPGVPAAAPIGIDAAGSVWLGHMAMLARFRKGRLEPIEPFGGLATLQPRSFLLDSRRRVWIGLRFGGVLMTANPAAETLRWVRYSTAEGLSSDTVWSLAEDTAGRIYLGTGRGLDQLDADTGRIRNFSTVDGLAGNVINDVRVDSGGRVWVATTGGLSRLDLGSASGHASSLPVYITRIQIAGSDYRLAERGESLVERLEVPWSRRNLRIEFLGLSFTREARLKYRYRLDGIDHEWSSPGVERVVSFPTLVPGHYRFQVRAVNDEGAESAAPAAVDFVVLQPFWLRPWFLTLLISAPVALIALVYRLRRQRRRAMEAVRRQVATDLHDDVGSGLSQIAILSEVLQRQVAPPAASGLADIARTARSLRESMSDIVWAIDPRQDCLSALVDRMRQAAFTLLDFGGLRVEFDAPGQTDLDRVNLPPDRRRHLLLIFKEAITNAAQHAGASRLHVLIQLQKGMLCLRIQDNGRGFEPQTTKRGQGLDSIERRAASMGAALVIESRPDAGTTIQLNLALS